MTKKTTERQFFVIPAVFVILSRDEMVFFMRRYNTGYSDGLYTIPSGHVEKGERLEEAAVRETKEETGVDIEENDLILVDSFLKVSDDGRTYANWFYLVKKWNGEPRRCEGEKCDDARWIATSRIPENTLSYVKDVVLKL